MTQLTKDPNCKFTLDIIKGMLQFYHVHASMWNSILNGPHVPQWFVIYVAAIKRYYKMHVQ